ncbi:unnamed protein product [Blepharisma stoltei]|uniref:Uncharacterized protein n=1 Tax=Blepharisma stoltei TaxID=1481888 RepID=A0AAU9KAE7_9CILI|nr:unnamed protein product [Blepharisma stoltei]
MTDKSFTSIDSSGIISLGTESSQNKDNSSISRKGSTNRSARLQSSSRKVVESVNISQNSVYISIHEGPCIRCVTF